MSILFLEEIYQALYTAATLKLSSLPSLREHPSGEYPSHSDFFVSIQLLGSVTKPLPTLENPTHLYSNPYNNADEKQQKWAIRSEYQDKETSTRRASANTSEPCQAFPVIGTLL